MQLPLRWPLVGERRALSLLMLGFYTTLFAVTAIAQGGAWARCFGALALAYGVGFFGLASEWFWARWYATGIAASGVTMAVLGLVTTGWNGALALWGGMHLLMYLPLLGVSMGERYEGQPGWRERYGVDEHGAARLKRAVNGAATSLPTLIVYTLAPREGQGALLWLLAAAVAAGLYGVVRMRVWGLAVLLAAAVGSFAAALTGGWKLVVFTSGWCGHGAAAAVAGALALAAGVALVYGLAPFGRPAWKLLRGR